ncbi:MAG: RHS repeat-associated core domain-containing protein, partial [Phycisphaerales bacterium]|nr:RHS repeat-associated core domain-containing protein [Phycisphaerales bacterium]
YHVRHRVYDPREGRWMQNDPLGFGAGDQDLYRYCGGEYSMGYDPLGLESGMGETITTGGDGCVCGDERGGTDNAPQGRRGDIFDQLGVGEDRLNGNTRAGQRERSEDSLQIGRNVTGVAYGLNNGIADAAGGFFSMFNPVNILQAIQSTNKRLNALAEGDPLPMLDFLLSPVDAANGIADRWNNASEEERYYMVSYGTGYVGTTAALTYASGVALPVGVGGIGMNSLRYSGGIGRVYYIIDVSNGGKAIRIGQTMRGFYANGELIRAGENIRKLYASGRYTSLDYIIVETLPRGCTRADVLRAEAYHFRLYQLSKRNTRSLPPENPVMR